MRVRGGAAAALAAALAAAVWAGAAPAAGPAGPEVAGTPQAGALLLPRLQTGERQVVRWKLPGRLDEISGLAVTPDGRLLGHEDQHAIVYELDWRSGRLVKAFALGGPTVRGDFEGIAVAGDRVFLVTSNGRVFEAREAGDGERVRYHVYDTGVEETCREVEGLEWDPREQVLLLACKRPREGEGEIRIHRWSPLRRAPADPPVLRLDARGLSEGDLDFRPSGLALDPESGHLLVLSSRTRSVAELGSDGALLGHLRLPPGEHPQAEGLARLPDGALAVADEAAGGKKARLAVIPSRGRLPVSP